MKSVTKYYNKTMRLRQMNHKVNQLEAQIYKEAINLIIEIYSNQVAVPTGFTWDSLFLDSKLKVETWNQLTAEFQTWRDSQESQSTGKRT